MDSSNEIHRLRRRERIDSMQERSAYGDCLKVKRKLNEVHVKLDSLKRSQTSVAELTQGMQLFGAKGRAFLATLQDTKVKLVEQCVEVNKELAQNVIRFDRWRRRAGETRALLVRAQEKIKECKEQEDMDELAIRLEDVVDDSLLSRIQRSDIGVEPSVRSEMFVPSMPSIVVSDDGTNNMFEHERAHNCLPLETQQGNNCSTVTVQTIHGVLTVTSIPGSGLAAYRDIGQLNIEASTPLLHQLIKNKCSPILDALQGLGVDAISIDEDKSVTIQGKKE